MVYAESYAKPYAKRYTRAVYAKPYAEGIRKALRSGSDYFPIPAIPEQIHYRDKKIYTVDEVLSAAHSQPAAPVQDRHRLGLSKNTDPPRTQMGRRLRFHGPWTGALHSISQLSLGSLGMLARRCLRRNTTYAHSGHSAQYSHGSASAEPSCT